MNVSNILLTVRWNDAALRAIVASRTSPPVAARLLAILHTAIYDAWSVYDPQAISTTTAAYIKRHDCSEDDIRKAISYAAFGTLTHNCWSVLPYTHRHLFRDLMKELGYDPDDQSQEMHTPQGIGNLIAQLVNGSRHGDGANAEGVPYQSAPWSDRTHFHPVNDPEPQQVKNIYLWQPLLKKEGGPQRFTTAHWSLVRPFALKHSAQFRPQPPCAEGSVSDLRRQAEEVLAVNLKLTPMQKTIAEYWNDGPGSVTPPGHWCEMAQYIAARNNLTEEQGIKLFFVLGNALLDTSIAAWEAKRHYESARPISVIRYLLHRREWISYLLTPPSPAHASAHSAFAGAAAAILKNFTGSDEFGAEGVLEKGCSLLEPGMPEADIPLAPWPTFTAAAEEAGRSRVYGGVQFTRSIEDGRELGRQVGARAWAKARFYFNEKQES